MVEGTPAQLALWRAPPLRQLLRNCHLPEQAQGGFGSHFWRSLHPRRSPNNRLPPQNLEAEQSILGAVLIDNDALPKALEILDPEDFYKGSHRKIFYAMTELFDRNEAIDLITITDLLKKNEELEAIGGISYLSSLVNMTPTAANVKYHSNIVREKALLRGLLHSANEIIQKRLN